MSFWKDKKLLPWEKNERLMEKFRKVFNSEDGKIVLNALMTDLFLFEKVQTDRQNNLNDYAKFFIRNRLGISETKALTDFIAQTAASEGGK